jgi:hypothetical protein
MIAATIVFSLFRGVLYMDIGTRTQVYAALWHGVLDIHVDDWRGSAPLPVKPSRLFRTMDREHWVALAPQWSTSWHREHRQVGTLTFKSRYRFPLWPALVATLAVAAVAWGVAARGRCRTPSVCRCGYDLTGLPPGSPCPECAAIPRPAAKA